MEITFDGGKVITAHLNGHIIKTDQSVKSGGQNSAPAPYDLFLASIGTCAGIYVKSFCDQREIPSENIKNNNLWNSTRRRNYHPISDWIFNCHLIFQKNIKLQSLMLLNFAW